jgi:transposase
MSRKISDKFDGAEFLKLYNEGKTLQQVGDMYGISQTTVSNTIKKSGLKVAHRYAGNKEKVVDAYNSGMTSVRAIMAITGFSETTVRDYLNEHKRKLKALPVIEVNYTPIIEKKHAWTPTKASCDAMNSLIVAGHKVTLDFKMYGFWVDNKYVNPVQIIDMVKKPVQKQKVRATHLAFKNDKPKKVIYV